MLHLSAAGQSAEETLGKSRHYRGSVVWWPPN